MKGAQFYRKPSWMKKGAYIKYAMVNSKTEMPEEEFLCQVVSDSDKYIKLRTFASEDSEIDDNEISLEKVDSAPFILVEVQALLMPIVIRAWELRKGDVVFPEDSKPFTIVSEEAIDTPIGNRRSVKTKIDWYEEWEGKPGRCSVSLWYDKTTGILLRAHLRGADLKKRELDFLLIKSTNIGELHEEKPMKFTEIPRKSVSSEHEAVEKETPKTSSETMGLPDLKYSRNVFIVHGKDHRPKLELARVLEKLGFNAIILSEQPDKGRAIIEKLEQETVNIGYAFVILTPDDFGGMMEELKRASKKWRNTGDIKYVEQVLKARARQNVVLELGYLVGKIGRNRVCCLYKGEVELPSDIHGVLFKRFNESIEECYKGIIHELKAAGYELKL